MSNQKWAKIMAILALAWIIISIIWTWILFIVEKNAREKEIEKEIKKQIEEHIKNYSWSLEISTWEISTWTTTN